MSKKKPTSKKPKKSDQKSDPDDYKKLYENTGPIGMKPSKSMPKVTFQKSISKQPNKKFEAFGRYLKHKFGSCPEPQDEPVVVPKKRAKPFVLKNLYDLLKVGPDSSKNEISKSYRKLVVVHHPDKGGDALVFRCLNKAYEILTNEEMKSVYDNEGLTGIKKFSEIDLTEIEEYLTKL